MDESPETLAAFRRGLLDFFEARARTLPWRATTDPYAIWVSEIMAQQTRVETVVPYYARWLDRFPTVKALADAPLDEVLKAWEGLGYYSRARNLHRAARMVVRELGGVVPDSVDGLRALPGVGDYTAGAIASIAFDRPVAAVDGNVRRVHARLLDVESASAGVVQAWAARVVDPTRPGDFNQALMELGATVCTPRKPDCPGCPVAAHCAARAAGTVARRPAPKVRAAVRKEVRAVGVFTRSAQVLLRRRPDDGLLAGLWDFPSVIVPARASDAVVARAVKDLARSLGLDAGPVHGPPLPDVNHAFSHLHVTYRPRVVEVRGEADGSSVRWVGNDEVHAFAIPVAQRRILDLLAG